jgi:hypothetical protein
MTIRVAPAEKSTFEKAAKASDDEAQRNLNAWVRAACKAYLPPKLRDLLPSEDTANDTD